MSCNIKRILSKHNSDLYCLNYLHSLATESKHDLIRKYLKIKDFCNLTAPSEDIQTLQLMS